ncbi:histidine phosphatase family protein [Planotetraspora sp. A-T 1434]|uniref:histidine phosphatase family protein n=1 Tax=Planotetraspora sp. A-T 1434 TaxID=2979219 RepID=UPI0021BEA486|nr:histidine phosphatase family protein [Planotetraspora sp. A-T 1434]MCT9933120.1 histidine phosphatase family protein [Planotetraspora sp. A-T 1434]
MTTCPHPERSGPAGLLYAVRHGQSTGNAAFAAAEIDGTTVIPSDDMAISLTDLGERQAAAVGRWLAALAEDEAPDMVWCSPYLRAGQTWQVAERELGAAGRPLPCHRVDGRLRDRDRGRLKHLHPAVVRERFPGEPAKEARDTLRYRPPGGESFLDVAGRLRGVLADIEADHRHRRVLIVAHDAVVLFFRQILERLTDADILAIAGNGLAGNGSITTWRRAPDGYRLLAYDDRSHLPG